MTPRAFFRCTPERIRTSNRLIRSQVLYPVELRVRINKRTQIENLYNREPQR